MAMTLGTILMFGALTNDLNKGKLRPIIMLSGKSCKQALMPSNF
jgi:hypothetical protein